jgi:hypothetical protein
VNFICVRLFAGDIDLLPMTWKINRVPDSQKDKICTKFGQNPLKDVDPRVFTQHPSMYFDHTWYIHSP